MKLKPCPNPWCPSTDHKLKHEFYVPRIRPNMGELYQVECSVCPIKGPIRKTEAKAVIAWNTRKKI